MEEEDIFKMMDAGAGSGAERNYADEIVENIEKEYKGEMTIHLERKKEKAALEKELASVRSKLSKCKNVRNHKKVEINRQISERRKQYKARITELKDQIYNIDLEEKGSNIKSSDLVNNTLKENAAKEK